MTLRWLPNALSLLRLAIIPPLLLALWQEAYMLAFWLFFAAGASDALDGWLARYFGWHSALGANLDAAADKLLMVSIFVVMGLLGLVSIWLVLLVFTRDLGIVLGAWYGRHRLTAFRVRPSPLGKLHTAVLIAFVLLVIVEAGWSLVGEPVMTGLTVAAAISVLVSGADYLYALLQGVRESRQE
jgi:cardiolipin synthase